jgi:mono/diheme cytochrome c family protein
MIGKKLLALIAVLAVAFGVYLFVVAARGPMEFAGGKTVKLAEYKEANPTGVPAALASASLIARGEYLTNAADCVACHTVDGGQEFAGGRAFHLPFGTLYTPNITPDKETGIGNWTDAQFLRAVHEGIAEDGSHLYPAFPYASYTYLTDEDVLAIKAYLFSLAPVHAPEHEAELRFPYNQRWLMTVWSAIFRDGDRFQPNAGQSAAWNRGAYLVEALGHCGDCHTPRSALQGLNHRKKFEGAQAAGWHAYNITSDKDSGIGAWSDEDLGHYLSTGHAHGRGSAAGPMDEVVDLSLSHLAASDIAAIVTYMRSIPAEQGEDSPPVRKEAAPPSHLAGMQGEGDARGKRVYAGACASCHDWTGVSRLAPEATLVGKRTVNDPTGVNVVQVIVNGEDHGAHHALQMPKFGAGYSDAEIASVANYVVERFGGHTPNLTADDVADLRWDADTGGGN